MSHHRMAAVVTTISILMIVVDGAVFARATNITTMHGIYCIWMTALTVGGDVAPRDAASYLALAFAPVPLLGAVLGLFTSALANVNIEKAEQRIKEHTEARIRHHLKREEQE
jgi:hypothetical protein